MRKFLPFILCLLLSTPSVFAITNLQINGQKQITINQPDVFLTCTGNLSATGARIKYFLYEDINGNGHLDDRDHLQFDGSLADGIGWIGLLRHPLQAIIGDENGEDGTLEVTMPIVTDLINRLPKGTLFLIVEDADGSKDMVTIHMDNSGSGTIVSGRVTGPDGGPLAGILIDFGSDREDGFYWKTAHSDANGYYTAVLPLPGTWTMQTFDTNCGFFISPDLPDVTLNENESKTVDIQMNPANATVEGHITFADSTPVAGAQISFWNAQGNSINITTDSSGYYKIGATAGTLNVLTATPPVSADSFFIPVPPGTSIDVAAGETAVFDFQARHFSAWITGDVFCEDDGIINPNPGDIRKTANVEIAWTDEATGQKLKNRTSPGNDGTFKLGMTAGNITNFFAYCTMISSALRYGAAPNGTVEAGQIISDVDLTIVRDSARMMTVAGEVKTPDGNPAANVYVAVFNPWLRLPETQGYTFTDAQGKYSLPYLASLKDPSEYFTAKTNTPAMINSEEKRNVKGYYWNLDFLAGVFADGFASDPDINTIDDQTPPGTVTLNYNLQLPSKVLDQNKPAVEFRLQQNFPNPFNASTFLYYDLPQNGHVKIIAYNIQGQEVGRLVDGFRTRGSHTVRWHADNLPSGQYYLRMTIGDFCAIKRCTLLK